MSYDGERLKLFSKIIPRFVLLNHSKATKAEKIDICILYNGVDEASANAFADKIRSDYPNGLKNIRINVSAQNYSKMEGCSWADLIFLFDSDVQTVEKTVSFAKSKRIFTMSYDPVYLRQYVMSSLFLGRKVVPYLNVEAVRRGGLELDSTLVQISKLYTDEDAR